MKDQLAVQNFLKSKYGALRAKNSSFSMRAFSKRIGLTSGATSEILSGSRRVTKKLAEKIALNLKLDPIEKNEILRHFEVKPKKIKARSKAEEKIAADYIRVGSDEFKIISHWIHFGLLNHIKTENFSADRKAIAERFGMSEKEISDALARLEKLGLIRYDSSGSIARTDKNVYTSDEKHSECIQQSHREDLKKAEQALQDVPIELRDFTALTITANPARLAKAKELIRKLQDEVADELETGPQTEVYKLAVYLYPLTKTGGQK